MSSPTAVTSRKPFDHNQPSVSGTTADAEPSSPVKVLEFVKVVAPLRGPISVRVNKGSIVNQGDLLAVQVSTKTELQIRAPFKGIVQRIVTNGKSLDENEVIAELEEL